MREPTRKEIQHLKEIYNHSALSLPPEVLRKALLCDGCKKVPVVNPLWLVKSNPRFGAGRKYILGCPSTYWGCAEAYETLMEAIDNWNWHVEQGGHYCGQ